MGLPTSKLEQYKLLMNNRGICAHIPTLMGWSQENCERLLQQFPIIYVKPENSLQGRGVLRIDRLKKNKYRLRSDELALDTTHNASKLWPALTKNMRKRAYVIQQGINSSHPQGEVADIRVYMIRRNKEWTVVGAVSCLANTGAVTTNYKLHTSSKPLVDFLAAESKIEQQNVSKVTKSIYKLATTAVETMSKEHTVWDEYTVDITMDQHKHLWVLETNIAPRISAFRKGDFKVFTKIIGQRVR